MKKTVLTRDVLISREIEYMIETGQIKEGEKLPSERALAEQFKVNRGTVRNAMQILVDRGRITAKDRSGYYVTAFRVSFDQDSYNSRKNIITMTGRDNYVKLLSFEKTMAPEKMTKKTKLPEDTQVFRIMRLRFVDGVPIAIERTHILREFAPELNEIDVHDSSIYETLRKKYGIYINRADARITAVYANGLESELLNIDMNQSVIRYEGLVYDWEDRLIEYYDDIMLKEKVEFISNEVGR